jgi:hypothetical protein
MAVHVPNPCRKSSVCVNPLPSLGGEVAMIGDNEGAVWASVVAAASLTAVIGLLYLPLFLR